MIPLLLIGTGAYLIYDSQKPEKMAKGGILSFDELDEINKDLVKNRGFNVGDKIKFSIGEKGNLLFPYKEYEAQIIGFIEKGKYKELYVKTMPLKGLGEGPTIDYYSIIDKMAKGGAVKRFVEMRKGKPVYALKDAIFHMSLGKLNEKGFPETTGTAKVYRENTGLQKINDYKNDKDYYVVEEKEDESGIYHISFADNNRFVVSFDRDDLYENGGLIENPVFTFKTDNDYHNARSSGYIDDYDIVRIEVKHPSGGGVDFATHSEEEYFEALDRIKKSGAKIVRTYQDKMYYDINDYYDPDEDKGGDDDYASGGEIDTARSYVMFIDTLQDAERLGFGGKVKFKDKVKSISENLKGRKVPKRLQKEYGKTYDKKWERDESARRIAGSQLKRMNIK